MTLVRAESALRRLCFSSVLLLLLPCSVVLAQEPTPSDPPDPKTETTEGAVAVEEPMLPDDSASDDSGEAADPEAVIEEESAIEEDSTSEDEAPEVDPNRVSFSLKLEDGGTASGSTGTIDYVRDDFAVLDDGVEIVYRDVTIQAQRAEVDLESRVVTAIGEVVLDEGPRRLSGASLTYDLEARTGKMTDAHAYVTPDYYFWGEEITKVSENVYTVVDGVFSSCTDEVPDWSFRLGEARIEVEGYARIKHAAMKIKKVPVFYTPYLVWPAKTERTSGLLVPNIGYSDRRGAYFGLGYYQVLGRSYDTTFLVDGYSKGYFGVGNEFRYQPSEGTGGHLEVYAIQDAEQNDDWRWKAKLEHVTENLPFDMRGVIDWEAFSDLEFFQDFERDFDRNSRRFQEGRAFATGNWGPHLLNLLVTDRETFTTGRNNVDRRLPELKYQLRNTRLGKTPLYLALESSASYLSVDRSDTYEADYSRFDLFPQISLPWSPAAWLSLNVRAGHRFTSYSDSLNTDPTVTTETGSSFSGDSLSRSFSTAGLDIVGPSFSRIIEADVGGFGKFKHVIEPRFSYNFISDFDEQAETPRFDGVDSVGSQSIGRFSLFNRLLAKPKEDEEGNSGSAREILSLEIAQSYSFDDERSLQSGTRDLGNGETEFIDSQKSPIRAVLRYTPAERILLRADTNYNTLFSQITSFGLSATARFNRSTDMTLRYNTRFRAVDGETISDQIRLGAGFMAIPNRLAVRASINYDLERSELQEQRWFLDYTSQCYSVRLEFRDFQVGDQRDTDYRIAFTLKNVGTFLDLTGRYD